MKIKLDENLPVALLDVLRSTGHDVDTVGEEALQGKSDKVVWQAAQQAGRFLITQDLDFSDTRSFAPGTHFGILLVRLGKPGRRALAERVARLFQSGDIESWRGCFVVASDCKLRVRRPTV
jgi:predicted nuclease of predicted toxin-antitoxin system